MLFRYVVSQTFTGVPVGHGLYTNCPKKIGPPNSLLLPPLCAYNTSAPNLSWCLPWIEDRVSFAPTCRFSNRADCDVPVVKVGCPTIGTTNCVPNTTGSNCVMGEAN